MASLKHSPDDEAIVRAQLGRPLRGEWGVARRCHLGVPMVIENHPLLEDGSPFPTLFWLTCPVLLKSVSKLESRGDMSSLNQRLQSDADLRSRVDVATERLIARRDSHHPIEDSGAPPGGGSGKVKCLHAHVANELAQPGNPIGALALEDTGWPDCRTACFAVVPDGER